MHSDLTILYIGADIGTSRHRMRALQRLGCAVFFVDLYAALHQSRLAQKLIYKIGSFGLERRVTRKILSDIEKIANPFVKFDVIWIDNGDLVGAQLAKALKKRCRILLNHNLDNPFSSRDGLRWRLYHKALPYYDLVVYPRLSSVDAAYRKGAAAAIAVAQSADEAVHKRIENASPPLEVVFVGTWMEGRGAFMKRLVDRGVPLKVFGPRWSKAPEYKDLKEIIEVSHLGDDAYVDVLSRSKIALALLSEKNFDLHTTRSFEIPAIETLLCAPRTTDHMYYYQDGVEACFFETVDECADLCLSLLANDARRASIARLGHERALRNNRFNEPVMRKILIAGLMTQRHALRPHPDCAQ